MLIVVAAIVGLFILLWWAGAIYYDVGGESTAGAWAGIAWIALWILLLATWHPLGKPLTCLYASFSAFFAWWLSQRPSHDRDWDPHFEHVASVSKDGDVLTIRNIRNSEYRQDGESTAHFETRTYRLSQLCGLDALVLRWGSPWMSHPMFVFDFGPDGRLCISVEVRYRRDQQFSFVRSLYRRQEIIYVVSDERDAILRRTKWLIGHDLYLYHLQADNLLVLQFFVDYARRINALASHPCWYHGLTTNCTTSIYSQSRGHIPWHWRMLFNGSLDKLLYDRGLIDQSMPFDLIKQQSWINDVANAAPKEGFGDHLRANLPAYGKSTSTISKSVGADA